MNDSNELDDFARIHAFEHIVSSLALMWSVSFAQAQGGKPTEAVAQLRHAIVSSLYDSRERPKEFRDLMKSHCERIFEHIEKMARNADQGFK